MATQPETIEFILSELGNNPRFTTRKMFGEYALYADGKVVALVCDDQLYVKIIEESHELEDICEKDSPYSGAKPHYLVEESLIRTIPNLDDILFKMAFVLKPPVTKKNKEKLG